MLKHPIVGKKYKIVGNKDPNNYRFHNFPVGSIVTFKDGRFYGECHFSSGYIRRDYQVLYDYHWVPFEEIPIEPPEAYKNLFVGGKE